MAVGRLLDGHGRIWGEYGVCGAARDGREMAMGWAWCGRGATIGRARVAMRGHGAAMGQEMAMGRLLGGRGMAMLGREEVIRRQ